MRSNERGPVEWKRRLTRRQFLATTGRVSGSGALAALAAACTRGRATGASPGASGSVQITESVPGPPPVSGGRYGGRVVVGWTDGPNSFDPALGYSLSAWDGITELAFFGGLLAYDGQTGGPAPNLAAAMPQVSSDGTTLVFTLRPGVKFHNGREITAEDFKYSWERTLDPSLASWGASYLSSVVGSQEITKGRVKTLEGVEVVDSRTLKVQLAQPDFTFLNSMCLPVTAPVPKEEVERLGRGFLKTPVGFGPFKVDSYDSPGQRATFVKNEDYFWKGLPYIDEVEFRWGIASQPKILQLQRGDLDIIGDGIPSTAVSQVTANPSTKPLVVFVPVLAERWITLYLSYPPLANQQVRQALNWAIDRNDLTKISYGEATPLGTPFPTNLPEFPRIFQPYGYDPQKARDLLSQAGMPSGFEATLTYSSGDPFPAIAQVVQQQLAAIGVKINLNQVGGNALASLEPKGNLQMTGDEWFLTQPTPADLVNTLLTTGASNNYNGYSNPQVDRLASQAKAEYDETRRNRIYAQIENLVGQDAPWVWLESFNFIAGRATKVANYQYRGELGTYYDRLWLTA